MNIHEKCQNWELDYSNPTLNDLTDEEHKILSAVLHLAGDVIASYNNIPKDIDPEIKTLVLDSLSVIFLETKNQVVDCIENSMSMHAVTTPLGKGYTQEEIFGTDLVEKFRTLLPNDKDLRIAAEHYGIISKDGEAEEDDDDLN